MESASRVQAEDLAPPTVVLPRQDPVANAVLFRALDVALASLLLVVLAPIFLLISIAVRLDSPGPVFFRQRRCGIGLSEFTIAKFRTMYWQASTEPHRDYVHALIRGADDGTVQPASRGSIYKLEDDERITRVGRSLRRFSLDELPQLWNVIRGDMSLVGPRPTIPYELEFYRSEWYGRFAVKPGMTGIWQVSGRNELNFAEMMQHDLDYVERRSLRMNVRILAKTGWVVVNGRGCA